MSQSTVDPKITKLQFTLAGFTQDSGFRIFNFERVSEDRSRTKCTVRANLAQARQYGIQVQDLPLLCRALLERRQDEIDPGTLTYAEEDMMQFARNTSANKEAAALKKKPFRKAPVANQTSTWRGPQ